MNTIRNKTQKSNTPSRNKTRKSNTPSRNNAIKSMYNKDYYGSDLLPLTNIINYINSNFNSFVIEKEEKQKLHVNEVDFADFFIVDDILNKAEKITNINIVIQKNPNMTLNKLLAYSIYLLSFTWFKDGIMNISSFKYQIGKDISRTEVKINNEIYVIPNTDYGNNMIITDKFNIKIMDTISKFSIIDFDLVNKIGILMCQNLFNFITQTIILMITHKIEPETSFMTKANKNIQITLTKNEQYIVFNFNSILSITYNKEPYLENTCGNIDFSFLIDLKKNIYKFTKFILNYDVEKCKPKDNDDENKANKQVKNIKNIKNKENTENTENNGTTDIIKYGIPMGILATGLVGTPFLLAALGGKNNKRVKRKSKKRIIKKVKRIKRQSKK